MRRWTSMLLTAACLTALLLVAEPKSARADEYWDGYWSWYDGTYSPYYTRRYYYSDPYVYGPPYRSYSYPGPYVGPRYYGEYYGTPRFGYRDYPGGGGQVRVGPLRFGWR
jgi:hypothetical protein